MFSFSSSDIPQQSWIASFGLPAQILSPRNLSKDIVLDTCLSWDVGLFICSLAPQMDIRHIFGINLSCILYLVLSPVFSPVTLSHWRDPQWPPGPCSAPCPVSSYWLSPCSAQGLIAQSISSAPLFLPLGCRWSSLSPEIKWVCPVIEKTDTHSGICIT